MPHERKKFLELARERFKLAQEADKDQRDREKADIEFYNGEQWPEDVKNIRKGQQAQNGMPPVPARPMITINKTREPVRQVLNQERQSDMGIEIVPADDFGDMVGPIDETEIQLREGLVRRIQRESKASDARTWAFSRAVQAGRGYYVVRTRYASGKTNDQEIYIDRLWNQACASLDPAHEQPDGSDCEWEFIGTDMAWDAYVAEYPKRKDKDNALCDVSDADWRSLGDDRPEWFSTEGDTRMVRVVEYFYTERESRDLVTYQSGDGQQRVEWADEIEGMDGLSREARAFKAQWTEVNRRTVVEKRIKWAKIDGCDDDVLDETDWPGPDMPIVKVIGEELQPSNDKRRVEGMVRPMREPGYGFNVMVSRWIELIGLSPLTPVMMAEGQDEGYETEWDMSNTRTIPRLRYKQKDLEGNPAPAPTVAPARNPDIGAIAGSVQMFSDALQSTSGIHASALGEAAPSVRSKRQNQQLIEQSQQSVNHYIDNLQRSLRYEGQILNNLLFPIYGRPGRIARIVNPEGEAENVLIGQPMVMQGARPIPARPDDPNAKHYKLTKDAQFNVIVKVTKSFDSRREQEAQILGELIANAPETMTWFGDLWFENQDGPGHQQMADRAKVMLAPPIQQMLQAKQQGQDPQAAAAVAQKDQQIQAMQAELEKAAKPTAVEELKQQGQTQRDAMDLDFQREKLAVESETKLAVAELSAKVDRLALFLEERARLGVEQEAERARAHDVGMSALSAAQSAEQAEAGRAATAEEAEAARAHEADMAERAAAQAASNGGA